LDYQLREMVYKFAQEQIAPRAAEIDRRNEFPNDLWRKFGDLGLLGVTAPSTLISCFIFRTSLFFFVVVALVLS
jgi:alkylation response protein AidB-like acyl-CoA dehydrogenase